MKRRLLTLFAKLTQRRPAPLASIDFPRQGRSIVFGDDTAVVEFDIELGDEIVVRTQEGQTRYRVRGQVTKEHRGALRQARMLTVVTPRYAVVATPA